MRVKSTPVKNYRRLFDNIEPRATYGRRFIRVTHAPMRRRPYLLRNKYATPYMNRKRVRVQKSRVMRRFRADNRYIKSQSKRKYRSGMSPRK